MGKKNNKKKQSTGTQQSDSGSVNTAPDTADPPATFEIGANDVPSTSTQEPLDPFLEKHFKLFPHSILRKTPQTEAEKVKELKLRITAGSTLCHKSFASIGRVVNDLMGARERADDGRPVIPTLMLSSLTKFAANQFQLSKQLSGLLDMDPDLLIMIADMAGAHKELKLSCRHIQYALNETLVEEIDGEMYIKLEQLRALARKARLPLDLRKIAMKEVFETNWINFEEEHMTLICVDYIGVPEGAMQVGCEMEIMDYYLMRAPLREDIDPRYQTSSVSWKTSLNYSGIPLWVYDLIKPIFKFKFRVNYEPGDQPFICQIDMMLDGDEIAYACDLPPKITVVSEHVREYEMVLRVYQMEEVDLRCGYGRSADHILTAFFHFPPGERREDLIVWSVELTCELPGHSVMVERVGEHMFAQEIKLDQARMAASERPMVFKSAADMNGGCSSRSTTGQPGSSLSLTQALGNLNLDDKETRKFTKALEKLGGPGFMERVERIERLENERRREILKAKMKAKRKQTKHK